MRAKIFTWTILIVVSLVMFSCAPTKNAAYFQKHKPVPDLHTSDQVYYLDQSTTEYIEIGDELYISVTSGNDEPNSFDRAQAGGGGVIGLDLLSYRVNDEGNIKIPYLNLVKAQGLSIKMLSDTLEQELSQYIYLPSVSVRIVNNRVTVLGEVNSPGVYTFNRSKVGIFEVLANAGDIAPFGNRKNVLIVRKENNVIKKKYVDLTNDEIVTSQWHDIQAEDIIYVEPLSRRSFGTETFSIFDLFGLITGTVTVYLLLSGL